MRSLIGSDTSSPVPFRENAALPFSDSVQNRVLAANTAETLNIPEGARFVSFSANAHFWTQLGASVAIPAVDDTDGSASVLNPALRKIPDGATQISVISASACLISFEFWS